MNSYTLLIEIGLLILLSNLAALFALAKTAFARIRIKEIVESENTDLNFTNLWLKNSAKIQGSVTIWYAIFLVFSAVLLTLIILALNPSIFMLVLIGLFSISYLLIWTLLVPCWIGTSFYLPIAIKSIAFMHFWSIAWSPLNVFLLKSSALLATFFNVKAGSTQLFINEDVDDALSDMGDKDESLEADEHEMIKSIYEFGDTVVREVMTPRTDMIAMPNDTAFKDIIKKSIDSGHSRIPVFQESSDNIIGIFYVRDALKFWNVDTENPIPKLADNLREPLFVPETKKVNELLNEFRTSKIQLAVIVDEYGGTAGIATMEDLLEEIVGEIQDEFDDESQDYQKIDENTYEIDASIAVDDVNDLLNINLPEEEDFDTLGGYIMFKLGHLPTQDEELIDKDFDIKVLAVSDRRIDRVRVVLHIKSSENGEN